MLTSSASTGNQWYLNGNSLTNDTLQNFSPVQSGNYTITVTDTNGCSATSAAYNFVTTGGVFSFDPDDLNSGITIYPNPSNGIFNLSFRNKELFAENAELNIFNSMGVKVYSENIGKPLILNPGLANGIYFIQVRTEDNIFYKKIIVQ